MTTLRNFQSEMDDIRNREQAKHRVIEKQKQNTSIHTPSVKLSKGNETSTRHAASDNSKPIVASGENPSDHVAEKIESSLDEADIINLIASVNPGDHELARDRLAALLTLHHGEYVLRIGAQPSPEQLFELPPAHIAVIQSRSMKTATAPPSTLTADLDLPWTGVEKSGEEIDRMLQVISKVIEGIGGKSCVLFETKTDHPRAIVLLRLPPLNVAPEVRCAVVGNVDSGKSTTLGVLTRGALDDGRGRARVQLFRHKHELETGRTSSIGMEILGFDTSGLPILPNVLTKANDIDTAGKREKLSWEQISMNAAKIVSFIDLAGHERYLKTTLYGLSLSFCWDLSLSLL
jgi:hypothetical protein